MKDALKKLFEYHRAAFDCESFQSMVEVENEAFFDQLNLLFNDSLIDYQIQRSIIHEHTDIPDGFVVLGPDSRFVRLVDGQYIDHKNNVVSADSLQGKQIVSLTEYPKEHTVKSFIEVIYEFFPRKTFLTLLLTPFILLSAFYTNLFNTRLIFNDEVHTFVFITVVFLSIYLLDFGLKVAIKRSTLSILEWRSRKIERYLMLLLPFYNKPNIITKMRTIESSKKVVWESLSAILVDLTTFILITLVLVIMVGGPMLLLLVYYLLVISVFTYIRYKNYKLYLENEAVQQDLLVERISYYKVSHQFAYLDPSFYLAQFERVCDKAMGSDRKVSLFNYRWDEMIKISSFLASSMLFFILFYESKNSTEVFGILIALLILNGRLASSAIAIVTRGFHILSSTYHIKKAAESLFENVSSYAFTNGFKLDQIESISLVNFSLSANEKPLLNSVNMEFKRGVVYGISGNVGVGKSTFLQAITRTHSETQGDILYNDQFKLQSLDRSVFHEKIAYLDMNSDFVSGSLYYNFCIRGHREINRIVSLIKQVLKGVSVDYDLIFKTDVFSIPMSTGQKRIMLIAMTLSPLKDVYVFDEVFSNMTQTDLKALIAEVKQQVGNPMVFIVSHDREVLAITDVGIEIRSGKLMKASSSAIKVAGKRTSQVPDKPQQSPPASSS